jgi:hypothetical protein
MAAFVPAFVLPFGLECAVTADAVRALPAGTPVRRPRAATANWPYLSSAAGAALLIRAYRGWYRRAPVREIHLTSRLPAASRLALALLLGAGAALPAVLYGALHVLAILDPHTVRAVAGRAFVVGASALLFELLLFGAAIRKLAPAELTAVRGSTRGAGASRPAPPRRSQALNSRRAAAGRSACGSN